MNKKRGKESLGMSKTSFANRMMVMDMSMAMLMHLCVPVSEKIA